MCLNTFDKAADLDGLNHPILNFFYYLVLFNLVMLSNFCNVKQLPFCSLSCIWIQGFILNVLYLDVEICM
jgi:hypothetical protein